MSDEEKCQSPYETCDLQLLYWKLKEENARLRSAVERALKVMRPLSWDLREAWDDGHITEAEYSEFEATLTALDQCIVGPYNSPKDK